MASRAVGTLEDAESRVQLLSPGNQITPSQEPQAATYALKEQSSHMDLTGLKMDILRCPNTGKKKKPKCN